MRMHPSNCTPKGKKQEIAVFFVFLIKNNPSYTKKEPVIQPVLPKATTKH